MTTIDNSESDKLLSVKDLVALSGAIWLKVVTAVRRIEQARVTPDRQKPMKFKPERLDELLKIITTSSPPQADRITRFGWVDAYEHVLRMEQIGAWRTL